MLDEPVILNNDTGQAFVIGLHWKRLVTTGEQSAEKDARRYATRQGASHIVFARDAKGEVGAVGCARLTHRSPTALSLAYALCLQCEKTDRVLAAVRIDNDAVWVCAIADGLVINGSDRLINAGEVTPQLQDFSRRYPNGSVATLGDFLPGSRPLGLNDLFELARSHQNDCVVLPLNAHGARPALRWVAAASMATLAVLALNYRTVAGIWSASSDPLDSSLGQVQVSPEQAWRDTLAKWQQQASLAGPVALQQVLQAINHLPLELAGWQTREVLCQRQHDRWNCRVHLHRLAERRSTTKALLEQLPPNWKADWGDLDLAKVHFSTPAAVVPVSHQALPKAQQLTLQVLETLQRSQRAFATVDMGAPKPVALTAPLDANGLALARPPGGEFAPIVHIQVTVSGPLRSMYALTDAPISWNSIHLDVAQALVSDPGSARSTLTVRQARGELYATL